MQELVKRELYLKKIRPFIGKPLIKIITGIRRCGKSSMFIQIMDELRGKGVDHDRMIHLNMDDLDNSNLHDPVLLYEHITKMTSGDGMYYVFLDEIQNVNGWEKTANSLLLKGNIDLYISGSNSKLLSSELATFIAGRYVSIEMQTLSFKEFLEFKRRYSGYEGEGKELIDEYIRRGGFPLTSIGDFDMAAADKIVRDTYESIFFRDTVARNNIRNTTQLELLIGFMFDNIGNPFSARNISAEFEKNNIRMRPDTVLRYLDMMERAFLIRSVKRFDIRGKRIIGSEDKYYVSDVSMVYALIGFKASMISGIEENVVFLELLRRDYAVTVGRIGDKEIDFIGEKDGKRMYVQVTHSLPSETTADREFSSLEAVKDNYPKYLVVAERMWPSDHNGIIQMGLADFLLSDEY